jgi:hypothetical protein
MMVDNVNPNSQFHPYQPVNDTPNAERVRGGFGSLGSLGSSLSNMNWQQPVNKARDYARTNPAKALGALAALAIGAGLMRGRR